MARCDLCNKVVSSNQMEQLRDSYQIPGVIDICPECARWADKAKVALLDEIAEKMRSLVQTRKSYFGPIQRTLWGVRWADVDIFVILGVIIISALVMGSLLDNSAT